MSLVSDEEKEFLKDWLSMTVSREMAESNLQGKEDGCFLIRKSSSSQGDYVISVIFNGQVQHQIVKHKNDRMVTKSGKKIAGIPELIHYFRTTQDGLPALLGALVPRQGSEVERRSKKASKPQLDDEDDEAGADTTMLMGRNGKLRKRYNDILVEPGDEDNYSELTFVKFQDYELDRNRIQIFNQIGSGQFGDVFQGWISSAEGMGSLVAIKMLKNVSTRDEKLGFMAEAMVLKRFNHDNVLKLIAVVTTSDPLLIVTEYLMYGDLRSLLRATRKLGVSVTDYEKVHFATQIALGMEHLSSFAFVHRDLAARNVLVGEKSTVKIGDFGMSRKLESESDYYKVQSRVMLPIKWMAPECIQYRRFSLMSDVWAFGVVLWEVVAVGHSPYKKMENREVSAKVVAGYRLPKPKNCPSAMRDLMMQCWQAHPENRPSFRTLRVLLEDRLKECRAAANGAKPIDIGAAVKAASEKKSGTEEDNEHEDLVEMSPDDFRYVKDIGEGYFGVMMLMETTMLSTKEADTSSRLVAVRQLKEDASPDEEKQFIHDLEVFKKNDFKHENVVRLLGFSTVQKPYLVALEYMSLGDLHSYLTTIAQQSTTEAERLKQFPMETQVSAACQICCGCVYLTTKDFIHRDIACRNMLVGPGPVVKIADFGLGRVLDQGSYYSKGGGSLPVRWMAPEALLFGKFSEKSEVYSFGVCMYEILTFAATPYGDLDNEKVSELAQLGTLPQLKAPPGTPDAVDTILTSSLSERPAVRPPFATLHKILSTVQQNLESAEDSVDDNQGGRRHDSLEEIKKGWITKQGAGDSFLGRQNWKKRWFILYGDGTVKYFKSNKKLAKPAGIINLQSSGCSVKKQVFSGHGADRCFAIYTPARMYPCVAENGQQVQEWVEILKTFCSSK